MQSIETFILFNNLFILLTLAIIINLNSLTFNNIHNHIKLYHVSFASFIASTMFLVSSLATAYCCFYYDYRLLMTFSFIFDI